MATVAKPKTRMGKQEAAVLATLAKQKPHLPLKKAERMVDEQIATACRLSAVPRGSGWMRGETA